MEAVCVICRRLISQCVCLRCPSVTGDFSQEAAARSAQEYKQVTPGATVRSREQVLAFFDGLEMAEPGLVRLPEWRPDKLVTTDVEKVWFLGGAGRRGVHHALM
jgi:hypothetical protein